MSTPDTYTDWQEGQAPLKGRVLASTLRWLRDRILRIEGQGLVAEGIDRSEVSDDGRTFHLVTSQERVLADIELPATPWHERPEGHVAGLAYDRGDYWYDDATRSSYLVKVDHVASDVPGQDLAGGKYGYLARGGSDADPSPAAEKNHDIRASRRGVIVSGEYFSHYVVTRATVIPARLIGSVLRTTSPPAGSNVEVRLYLNSVEFARGLVPQGSNEGLWSVFPTLDKALVASDVVSFRVFLQTAGATVGDADFWVLAALLAN